MIGFPPTSPYRKKKTFIFFSCSIGLHLSLVLIIFLLTLRYPRTLLVPESGIPGSIRVDLVALPTELAYKKIDTSPQKTFTYQESKKQKSKLEETIESVRKKVELRKGNILSRGGTTKGEGKEHWYISKLTDSITENLELPAYFGHEQNRFAIFILYIEPNGTLKDIVLYTSSGIAEYDSLAFEAIKKTAPFEPPPQELLSLIKQGISIKIYPPQGR